MVPYSRCLPLAAGPRISGACSHKWQHYWQYTLFGGYRGLSDKYKVVVNRCMSAACLEIPYSIWQCQCGVRCDSHESGGKSRRHTQTPSPGVNHLDSSSTSSLSITASSHNMASSSPGSSPGPDKNPMYASLRQHSPPPPILAKSAADETPVMTRPPPSTANKLSTVGPANSGRLLH